MVYGKPEKLTSTYKGEGEAVDERARRRNECSRRARSGKGDAIKEAFVFFIFLRPEYGRKYPYW